MNKLSYWRRRRGLTQEELGKACKVTKQTIWKWEHNVAPVTPKHSDILKNVLKISEADLMEIISETVFSAAMEQAADTHEVRANRRLNQTMESSATFIQQMNLRLLGLNLSDTTKTRCLQELNGMKVLESTDKMKLALIGRVLTLPMAGEELRKVIEAIVEG